MNTDMTDDDPKRAHRQPRRFKSVRVLREDVIDAKFEDVDSEPVERILTLAARRDMKKECGE